MFEKKRKGFGNSSVSRPRELRSRRGNATNLAADASLAALCIEHGLEIVSADTDFARFGEVSWVNPIAG